jgi:hypothetical protein
VLLLLDVIAFLSRDFWKNSGGGEGWGGRVRVARTHWRANSPARCLSQWTHPQLLFLDHRVPRKPLEPSSSLIRSIVMGIHTAARLK